MTNTTEHYKIDRELIKTDCIGRIKVTPQHREKLLDAFESSGMSGQKFAEHYGVKYQTFATWVQKRKKARKEYPVQHTAVSEDNSETDKIWENQASNRFSVGMLVP